MKDSFNQEKFNKILIRKPSKWKKNYEKRRENREWLEKSMTTALNVLTLLDEKNWSQKRLAEELGVSAQQVSKIVKGQVNFTYESITKLENALGHKLLDIPLIDRDREERNLNELLSWIELKNSLPTLGAGTFNVFPTQSFIIEEFSKTTRRVPKKSFTKMTVVENNLLKPTG